MKAVKIWVFVMFATLTIIAIGISTAASVSALICTHPGSVGSCLSQGGHHQQGAGHGHDSSIKPNRI